MPTPSKLPAVQSTPASVDEVGYVDMTYREAIRAALADALAADSTVVLLGEDVADAGGVFKTSEGLVERFGPDRVIDTPICENGFTGVALGMAVTGLRPVVEIMFSDFLPTAADAIVNEVSKFRFMSGGQCSVPMTIRAIGGATGRFGTQHSATGESWFMHVAGLRIAAASSAGSAYELLRLAIGHDDPVLIFEHKGMYGRRGMVQREPSVQTSIGRAHIVRAGIHVTVVSTLLMVERSLEAAEKLAAEGVDVEVIDLRWISPMDYATVAASLKRTGRLVIAEEQPHAGGWGATLISALAVAGAAWLTPPRVVSLPPDLPIPFSPPLEDAVVPSVEQIADSIREAVHA